MENKNRTPGRLIRAAAMAQAPTLFKNVPAWSLAITNHAQGVTARSLVAEMGRNVLAETQKTILLEETRKCMQNVWLRIAVCLDFTASTSSVVESFRAQSARMAETLTKECPSTEILPVAFMWPGATATSGSVGDLRFWNGLENVWNGRNQPPIVEGLREIERKRFFSDDSKRGLNFAVIATDERFERDPGYEAVIAHLQRTNAAVIAILSENAEAIPKSFEEWLGHALPERLFTVRNVSQPEKIAADLILGMRKFRLEQLVQETMRSSWMALAMPSGSAASRIPLLDRLAENLKGKGHSNALLGFQGATKRLE